MTEPPARLTSSPAGCGKASGVARVSVPAPTLVIVAESAVGVAPMVIESPTRKPVVVVTGIDVAPLSAPGGATAVPDKPRPTATTGMTCLLYTSPSPRDGLLSR